MSRRYPSGMPPRQKWWLIGAVGALLVTVVAWGAFRDIPGGAMPRATPACTPQASELPAFLSDDRPVVAGGPQEGDALDCGGIREGAVEAVRRSLSARLSADQATPWNRQRRFLQPEALKLWTSQRQIAFLGFEPWTVPQAPTWDENPFDDLSWLRTYHSLGWLHAAARAHEESGDPELADQVRHYVLSWIRNNPSDDPPSRRSWYDGAVALRTDSIVAFLPLLLETLDTAELEEVLRSLAEHGQTLNGYLSDPRWHGHNHNLFHALSLHNLATQVPELESSDQWRTAARDRIRTLQAEMLDRDGVSTEQAANYHYTAIRWFTTAAEYLRERDEPFTAEELEVLAKATRFGALLPAPHDELPAIGDTAFGRSAPWELLDDLETLGLTDSEASFILSRGSTGTRPADMAHFSEAGYTIMRPSYGDVGPWEQDLHVVVDMGAYRRVHGHRDAMNVLLSAHGTSLLVDSGGPFAYGVPRRSDYIHAAAHNTVVVDGQDHPDQGVPVITRTGDTPAFSLVEGTHEPASDVEHRRTVLMLKPDVVLVVDWLDAASTERHYELSYHLHPSASLERADDRVTATVGEASLSMVVATDKPAQIRATTGAEDSSFGWVTTGHRRETPTPRVSIGQTADRTWFVTALQPGTADEPLSPELTVEALDDGSALTIHVGDRRARWVVHLEPGMEPRVEPLR